jgi:uncharacterized protein YgbK (DUF1537 family)
MRTRLGSVPRLRAAFAGDDLTGSVDTMLQFTRCGWITRLFVGLPDSQTLERAAAESDVIGIAGVARSVGTDDLDAELRPVFEALRVLGAPIVQYTASSTADSSPSIGSIGRVLEIGRDVFGAQTVPLLFAQPGAGRYTLHGVHFAAEGGIVYRLDRQPTMSTHPSTPMTEPDLAQHFARQTGLAIGSIPFTAYDDDLASQLTRSDAAAVVLDGAIDEHLEVIGRAIGQLRPPVFAIGSGGLSLAIASALEGPVTPPTAGDAASGPVLALSGGRTPLTRRQTDAAAAAEWFVQPLELEASRAASQLDWVLSALRAGRSVALTADAADADMTDMTDRPMRGAIAQAFTAIAAGAATAAATRRLIVAGGETSNAVTRLLGIESLSIVANPRDDIVVLAAHASDPAIDGLELLVTDGRVGADDLFVRARALGD